MPAPPADPPIFHITHMGNLPEIVRQDGLFSDVELLQRKLQSTNIGHRHIKERRLRRVVTTHAGGILGGTYHFTFVPAR